MKKIYLLIIILLLIFSCATPEKTSNNKEAPKKISTEDVYSDLNIKIGKAVSWLNLMPGTKPRFHISGILKLLNGENYNYKNTSLTYVKIYQSGKELYFIQPKIIEKITDDEKNISFSTIKGLSINKDLKIDKTINMEFIFSSPSGKKTFTVKNVKIEEAH